VQETCELHCPFTPNTRLHHTPLHYTVTDLTSQFYQTIPHILSKTHKPPLIDTEEKLGEKFEMLSRLGDMIIVKEKAIAASQPAGNLLDIAFAELKCSFEVLPTTHAHYPVLLKWIKNTKGIYSRLSLQHVW
jgi:Poly(ADP-ribose) polymerase, regulatory domain